MAYYPPGSPHLEQQNPKQSFRLSRPMIIGLACAVAVALFLIFTLAFGVDIPAFQQGQVTEYARDGRTGLAYRVVLNPTCTDDQLRVVFNQITKDDGASFHTVFYWSSVQLMQEGYGYDVAMITDDNGSAVLERK